ncbi:pantoate--beta-alanine ligase [Solitalea canadensis]|uniref:Pantothenate synthetase n=1 Tax=Solitalea canadensis (strain ATCC 29591 / DSM 3403 / JCM 21819 / LMG 8368 / NBRC 15130 / NCIMB 12057 / USAM 9D) TaxID=929556 RepID=H8KXH6_SOLCM|nr:pantoate--beta-alanine ligase [Solitalea canadensis]AFD08505.1 pantoate--beta-alanine ligase [Solitalea canadensis DSM 3403]
MLQIFTTRADIQQKIAQLKSAGKKVGFVATMGALHEGHLALISRSKADTDITVCSIFVNPTQFNDPKDLEHYPRPIEADIKKLKSVDCDMLFLPSVAEMYKEGETWHMDLGNLENILEGAFRPGHYQGVTQIVKKLFDIIQPDKAYFGQKDFQQVLVIKKMIKEFNLPVELVRCPTLRDEDGLAKSSRNVRLNNDEHEAALLLSKALLSIKNHNEYEDLKKLIEKAKDLLEASPLIKVEYLVVANGETLDEITALSQSKEPVALVAAKSGNTRLIDNMLL